MTDETNETNDLESDRPRPKPVPEVPATEAETPAGPAGPVSAASRARRIGGRPLPQPEPVVATPPAPAKKPSKISLGKSSSKTEKPEKPQFSPPTAPQRRHAAPVDPSAPAMPPVGIWIPAIVLAAAAVVLAVLIAIAGHGVYYAKSSTSSSSRNAFSEEVLASAKTCMAAINTYDYRKIPAAEQAALACTTGVFTSHLKDAYEKTIKAQAPPAKAVQTAQINHAGIQSVSPDGKQVSVLVYGQLAITNVTQTTPRTDVFGTVVTLDKVGSKWLIAKYNSDTAAS